MTRTTSGTTILERSRQGDTLYTLVECSGLAGKLYAVHADGVPITAQKDEVSARNDFSVFAAGPFSV